MSVMRGFGFRVSKGSGGFSLEGGGFRFLRNLGTGLGKSFFFSFPNLGLHGLWKRRVGFGVGWSRILNGGIRFGIGGSDFGEWMLGDFGIRV